MATSANTRAMLFGDGVTVAGQDLRLGDSGQMTALGTAGSTGLASRGGVRLTGVGAPLAVTAGAGMSVGVAVGQCHVPAASGDSGGLYLATLDTAATLTVATADPSNPRIDLVAVEINDVGSSSSTATVNIISGTPAGSPSAPATPAGALALAQVLIPAGSSSVSSGNITDVRQWTAALGGILPVANSTKYPANSAASDYMHDLSTGRLRRGNGGTPLIAPFATTEASATAPVSCTSNATKVQVLAATVTTDGATTVRLTASWSHVNAVSAPIGDSVNISIWRDTTQLKQVIAVCCQTIHSTIDGASLVVLDTPSAAAHTYRLYMLNVEPGDNFQMFGGSGAPIELIVEPVLL